MSQISSPAMALSHHRSRPLSATRDRRKHWQTNSSRSLPQLSLHSPLFLSFFVVFLCWSCLSVPVAAQETDGDRQPLRVPDDLAWEGSSLIIVDTQPPPAIPLLMPSTDGAQDDKHVPSGVLAKRGGIQTDPNVTNSNFAILQPLDTGLSNNFTSGCGTFLQRLRADNGFKDCHPFSLMLQTSNGFFEASKSYLRITQTLDATCGVNATQCKKIMDGFSRELVASTACKSDLASDNPVIVQTYNGLVAYPVAYTASCLRDDEGSYCYANAVTNTSAASDSLPYYLPVGQELPGSSRLTCNSCLQDAMAVFAQYGNNGTQPISKTYASAAQQISIACGRSFVNVTAAPLKGAASPIAAASLTPTITLLLMFILYFFQ